jgi:hypothetical protein
VSGHRTVGGAASLGLDIDSCRFACRWNEGWPDDHGGAVLGFRVIDRDTVMRSTHG